jgi:hypothetical protein
MDHTFVPYYHHRTRRERREGRTWKLTYDQVTFLLKLLPVLIVLGMFVLVPE